MLGTCIEKKSYVVPHAPWPSAYPFLAHHEVIGDTHESLTSFDRLPTATTQISFKKLEMLVAKPIAKTKSSGYLSTRASKIGRCTDVPSVCAIICK